MAPSTVVVGTSIHHHHPPSYISLCQLAGIKSSFQVVTESAICDRTERPVFAVGYREDRIRNFIYYLVSILTFGLLALVLRWFPLLRFRLRFVRCCGSEATHFLLECVTSNGETLNRIVEAERVVSSPASRGEVPTAAITTSGTTSAERQNSNCDGNQKLTTTTTTTTICRKCNSKFSIDGPTIARNGLCNTCLWETRVAILFVYRCTRYILKESANFEPLILRTDYNVSVLATEMGCGISSPELIAQRRALFGLCELAVPLTPWTSLLLDELLHPFYVFQVFAVTVWLCDNYYIYAAAVASISLFSTAVELIEAMRNERRLNELCRINLRVNTVERVATCGLSGNGNECRESSTLSHAENVQSLDSRDLVPGHVVELTAGIVLPCDAILLSGTAVVNESMLTGESVPVAKSAITPTGGVDPDGSDDQIMDISDPSPSTLFSGTRVVAVKRATHSSASPRVLALVARTGFSTLQGSMLRSVLYPPPTRFSFYADSFRFLGVMLVVAVLGASATTWLAIRQGLAIREIVVRCLDLFTVAVPPALPAAMSVGMTIAVSRLRRSKNIACISPNRVNAAGQVNTVVFDKTGTLTKDGLEFEGLLTVQHASLGGRGTSEMSSEARHSQNDRLPVAESTSRPTPSISQELVSDVNAVPFLMREALALCHSLSVVDGRPLGDPLETLLLDFSGWAICEADEMTRLPVLKSGSAAGGPDPASSTGGNISGESTTCAESADGGDDDDEDDDNDDDHVDGEDDEARATESDRLLLPSSHSRNQESWTTSHEWSAFLGDFRRCGRYRSSSTKGVQDDHKSDGSDKVEGQRLLDKPLASIKIEKPHPAQHPRECQDEENYVADDCINVVINVAENNQRTPLQRTPASPSPAAASSQSLETLRRRRERGVARLASVGAVRKQLASASAAHVSAVTHRLYFRADDANWHRDDDSHRHRAASSSASSGTVVCRGFPPYSVGAVGEIIRGVGDSLASVDALAASSAADFRSFVKNVQERLGSCDDQATCGGRRGGSRVELGVLKRFEFVSRLQRMSVVVRDPLSGEVLVFAKGSPEVMLELTDSASVPSDVDRSLLDFTQKGRRVLGICARRLPSTMTAREIHSLTREDVEKNLTLLGFAVFVNELKEETAECISQLRSAGVACLMATGDNPITALSVSRECGITYSRHDANNVASSSFRPAKGSAVRSTVTIVGDLSRHIPSSRRSSQAAAGRAPSPSRLEWVRLDNNKRPAKLRSTKTPSSSPACLSKRPSTANACASGSDALRRATGSSHHYDEENVFGYRGGQYDDGDDDDDDGIDDGYRTSTASGNMESAVAVDLRELLDGCDLSSVHLVITGRALRYVKAQHDQLRLKWAAPKYLDSLHLADNFHDHDHHDRVSYHSQKIPRFGEHNLHSAVRGGGKGGVVGDPVEQSSICCQAARCLTGRKPTDSVFSSLACAGVAKRPSSQGCPLRCVASGGTEEDPRESTDWMTLTFRVSANAFETRAANRRLATSRRGSPSSPMGRPRPAVLSKEPQELRSLIVLPHSSDLSDTAVGDDRDSKDGHDEERTAMIMTPALGGRRKVDDLTNRRSSSGSNGWLRRILRKNSFFKTKSVATPSRQQHLPRCSEMDSSLRKLFQEEAPYLVEMSLYEFLLRSVSVFSRMSPDDKELLVASLRELPHHPLVAMCGDGANDCSALKSADVGISLSDAEASIAAPFTSTTKSVSAVSNVLIEGRAALVNSFQTFLFVCLYSVIQFCAVSTLYWFGLNMTDTQFTWVDLISVLPLSMLMSWTKPAERLYARLPTGSLVSPPILTSLLGQLCIQLCFTVMTAVLTANQAFYVPAKIDENTGFGKGDELASHQNTSIFLISNIQYSIICFVFSDNGAPWRKRIHTNLPLVSWLLLTAIFAVGLMLADPAAVGGGLLSALGRMLNLVSLPLYFRAVLVGIALADFAASWFFEKFVVMPLVRRLEVQTLRGHCPTEHPLSRLPEAQVRLMPNHSSPSRVSSSAGHVIRIPSTGL